MRRSQRLIAATIVIALSGALAGCSSMGNWDPTDMLDFLDTKKKLPGERKPVFPDGVPGLEQGVPKDLYKGARQQQIDDPERPGCGRRRATAGGAEIEELREIQGQAGAGHAAAAPAAEPAGGCRCRAGGRGQHRRRAAGAQAEEDRPQAYHRAAARSAGRASRPRLRPRNNPPRRSRPRCRAALSRVKFSVSFD